MRRATSGFSRRPSAMSCRHRGRVSKVPSPVVRSGETRPSQSRECPCRETPDRRDHRPASPPRPRAGNRQPRHRRRGARHRRTRIPISAPDCRRRPGEHAGHGRPRFSSRTVVEPRERSHPGRANAGCSVVRSVEFSGSVDGALDAAGRPVPGRSVARFANACPGRWRRAIRSERTVPPAVRASHVDAFERGPDPRADAHPDACTGTSADSDSDACTGTSADSDSDACTDTGAPADANPDANPDAGSDRWRRGPGPHAAVPGDRRPAARPCEDRRRAAAVQRDTARPTPSRSQPRPARSGPACDRPHRAGPRGPVCQRLGSPSGTAPAAVAEPG